MDMNPLYKQFLGSFIRWALTGASAWLIERGITTPETNEELLAGLAGAVAMLLWSLWQKRDGLRKFFTAAGSPTVVTMNEVKTQIANGTSAPASTPSNEVPQVTS